jgi:hypothetical protein
MLPAQCSSCAQPSADGDRSDPRIRKTARKPPDHRRRAPRTVTARAVEEPSRRKTCSALRRCDRHAEVRCHRRRQMREEHTLLSAGELPSESATEDARGAVVLLEAADHRPQSEVGDVGDRADAEARLEGTDESRGFVCDRARFLDTGGSRPVLGRSRGHRSGRRATTTSTDRDGGEQRCRSGADEPSAASAQAPPS